MNPYFLAATISVFLLALGLHRRQKKTPLTKFFSLIGFFAAIAIAITGAWLPNRYATSISPAENQVRIAGAWLLGQEVKTFAPRGKTVLIVAADEDLKAGTYNKSLLAAFQEGAGNGFTWKIFSAQTLNSQLHLKHPDNSIANDIVHAQALEKLLAQNPGCAAVVLLKGFPPSDELAECDVLGPVFAGKTSGEAPNPPFYTLDFSAERYQPMLTEKSLQSVVYYNVKAPQLRLDQDLRLEQAAAQFWLKTNPK